MTIAFELTMPNRGSWNGRWSGEDSRWIIVRNVGSSQKAKVKYSQLCGRSFYYRWNDGWGANVKVWEIASPSEARTLRKVSRGFFGYDWMVDSIIEYGTIYADHEKPKTELGATRQAD